MFNNNLLMGAASASGESLVSVGNWLIEHGPKPFCNIKSTGSP